MSEPVAPTMAQLLTIEDTHDLLSLQCSHTELPLWALIRTSFIRQILSKLIYNDTPLTGASTRTPVVKIVHSLIRSLSSNLLSHGLSGEVCFMTSSLGLIMLEGRYFDRINGHFVNATTNHPFVWEDQYEWRWIEHRAFERVYYHAPFQIAGAVYGRLRVTQIEKQRARELIDLASERCRDRLDLKIEDSEREELSASLSRRLVTAPFLFDAYRNQFLRRGVRLLFKEDASYSHSAIVMAAANAQGIETAEFQHGALSSAHDAYNFSPVVAEHSKFRKALPRHFLGYGDWWNSQINLPSQKVAIGNPHRDLALSSSSPSAMREGNILLVLGDGVETERYFEFLRQITPSVRAKGLRPVFRPHPLERSRVVEAARHLDIEVDMHSDIYDSFSEAVVVVSEISTGLFEAIGLVDHILIWNTPKAIFNFPEHPFQPVSSPEEFVEILKGDALKTISKEIVARIWAPSWRSSYNQFLASTLG